LLAISALLSALSALADSPAALPKLADDGSNYEQIFPLYAEECGLTQWVRLGSGAGGGAGHAVLYLKGVCYDGTRGYPRIQLCDELAAAKSLSEIPAAKLQDPDWGVGVSVDGDFTNVNWVAIPTKSLFFYGKPDLARAGKVGTPVVDSSALSQMVAAALPYYQGVQGILPEESKIEKLVENGIGTDIAIDFARKSYCERVPLGKDSLQEIVDFLNKKQDDSHAYGNVWDVENNSCATTSHNALASAGIRSPLNDFESLRFRGLGRTIIDTLTVGPLLLAGQVAVPANEFITLATDTTLNLDDMNPEKIYEDPRKRTAVLDPIYGSLPKELGALTEIIPEIAQENNEVYQSLPNPNESWMILDSPPLDEVVSIIPKIGSGLAESIDDSGMLPRHNDLVYVTQSISIYSSAKARANYFRDFYKKVQEKYLTNNPHPKDAAFTAYFERYQQLISDRLRLMDESTTAE
jgi:hypothetical protein